MERLDHNLNSPIHLGGDADGCELVATHDLRAGAKGQAILVYRGRWRGDYAEREVRCEIYEVDGELQVHTCCIRCGQALTIKQSRKQIDIEWGEPDIFGRRQVIGLHVEPFECTWELPGEGRRIDFGLNLCRARQAYDGKIVKDA